MSIRIPLTFAALSLTLAGLSACADSDVRIAATCYNYCQTQASCDGDVNAEECEADCKASLGDCQADEVAATLDELDACADDTCDDQGVCSLEADAQCYFGI